MKNKKLIMTLLVRDEADIVKHNIEHHFRQGVDFIIATDNGSVDGTREILVQYEKEGLVALIDEKRQDYSQSSWVNKMGRLARENYGADIVFHCDADEFWNAKSGNLKNELVNNKKAVILSVNLINVLLEFHDGEESFPVDAKYAVINPFETDDLEEDSKATNLYLFPYPPKVMFNCTKKLYEVSHGNHNITNAENAHIEISNDISIYHYPVRSKNHFFRKVKSGASACLSNPSLGEKTCWHWKRWYKSHFEGNLEEEYRKLTLTKNEAKKLLEKKIIRIFDSEIFVKIS